MSVGMCGCWFGINSTIIFNCNCSSFRAYVNDAVAYDLGITFMLHMINAIAMIIASQFINTNVWYLYLFDYWMICTRGVGGTNRAIPMYCFV